MMENLEGEFLLDLFIFQDLRIAFPSIFLDGVIFKIFPSAPSLVELTGDYIKFWFLNIPQLDVCTGEIVFGFILPVPKNYSI